MRGRSPPRFPGVPVLALASCMWATVPASSQAAELRLGVAYQCPGGASFTVFSCAGGAAQDSCDVETRIPGRPAHRGASPRGQAADLLSACQPAAGSAPPAGHAGADANGFRPGDDVQAATAGGWAPGKIVRANGDNYLVQVLGVEVWKTYPSELRRVGPVSAADRSRGVYALHDKVEVNVGGRWVAGEVVTEMGMDYNVAIPGNRTVWASGRNIRHVAPDERTASRDGAAGGKAPGGGGPPRPGMKSCAGKFEGRYTSSGAVGSGFQITFRSGKALLAALAGDDEFECWTEGDKIVLHKVDGGPANPDMPIDVNDDGSLQTPMGELRKKGK